MTCGSCYPHIEFHLKDGWIRVPAGMTDITVQTVNQISVAKPKYTNNIWAGPIPGASFPYGELTISMTDPVTGTCETDSLGNCIPNTNCKASAVLSFVGRPAVVNQGGQEIFPDTTRAYFVNREDPANSGGPTVSQPCTGVSRHKFRLMLDANTYLFDINIYIYCTTCEDKIPQSLPPWSEEEFQ